MPIIGTFTDGLVWPPRRLSWSKRMGRLGAAILLVTCACSSTRHVSIAELPSARSRLDDDARVIGFDGTTFRGDDARKVPDEAIRSIVIPVDRGRGGLEGMGIGTLIGAGAGVVLGLSLGSDRPVPSNSDCGCPSFSAGFKAVALGVVGAGVGLVVGLVTGVAYGHHDVVIVDRPQ
jgi:hypothetical protein